MTNSVGGSDNDGNFMLTGILHGIIGDVAGLSRRSRIKNRDTKMSSEEPRVLLCLRRLRPWVVTGDNYQTTF